MFTGIIEEIGIILNITKQSNYGKLTIGCNKILEDIKIGDSVSVDGICLTTVKINSNSIEVDIMNETLNITSLKNYKTGYVLNLERAMKFEDRFGGHFVSGHVDSIGKITKKIIKGNSIIYDIEIPSMYKKYLVKKGSISINGTSLTIMKICNNKFSLSIVTHTQNETTLGTKKIGDIINVEYDLISKYLESLIINQSSSQIRTKINSEINNYRR